ncbi:TetR family transcriptional regulator [Fusobacterium naviforme]|nr:TetR/AcrR family transcriptional regulator [Fusobacterium naviforme]PSL09875.1 TetR family transcriptional regulator [Fusobacterium naviforme]STO27838.1 probable dihydroxyacetone kinase regulator [Fusobacterium naviforme]
MAAETVDRRVRKTRATLRLCLGKLLKEKKIQEISVKEISELADINRGTFYLHYRDVYDLLSHIENDLFQQYTEILDRHKPAEIKESPKMLLTDLLFFIRENADLVQILMGPNGDIQFLNQLRDVFRIKIMEPWARTMHSVTEANYQYFYAYITEGTIGMIKRWVENSTDLAPEELAALSERFIINGAAGMNDNPL